MIDSCVDCSIQGGHFKKVSPFPGMRIVVSRLLRQCCKTV